MGLFVQIHPGNEDDKIIADSMGVQDPSTNPDDGSTNGILPSIDPTNPDNSGIIVQVSNQTNPEAGVDGNWIRQLKFTNDGKIYQRYRINENEWSGWDLIPTQSDINKTTIKDISISGKTITVTKGDDSTKTLTTQDTVTAVKGSQETTYRQGNVNLTAANVGAVPITGGNITGVLTVAGNASYNTAQVRNVSMSTEDPSGGVNGQIHFKYT